MLRVRFDRGGPLAEYACGELLRLLDQPWCRVAPGDEADLVYGTDAASAVRIPAIEPESAWDNPRPEVMTDDGLAIVHPAGSAALRRDGDGIGYDLFYAAYACLTAPWERIDPCNEVGTPIAREGWLARNGVLERPLVHEYAADLARLLRLEMPRREAVLVLTHDVDEQFAHLFRVREARTRFVRDLRAGSPGAPRRALGFARRVLQHGTDPNDRWAEWRGLVAEWGPLAFNVASYNVFDDGAERYDVAYDVRDPRVAGELRKLADAGAEIGIHFSLQARRSDEQVRREVDRLEAALDLPVRSARHHWWALGRAPQTTLAAQAAAGIRVDCSFGFNDRAGFRRGIALPFRAFDHERGQPFALWSLPTTVMDKAVVSDNRSAEEAVGELERLWETVCGVGGALVLDWHAHALNPRALGGAGAVYRRFVADVIERGARISTPLALADQVDRAA